ncbi:hypothetical protein VP1G_08269 [Cytospora mali]|uniref:PH domain-containing protein n=1 Tax=Cytospora mali TaxID=578113 RepID=A0A194VAQ8_CYTMA|nr:hypothetical protein VP1G_08269 [Valsa mali var. pyri (nom. inval.)]
MEGYLAVPPDRGTILGRAIWKVRYVVIGPPREFNAGEASSQGLQGIRNREGRGTSRSQTNISFDGGTYLSVYKGPDDWEPIQQFAVSNINHCQVQMIAHRKQGPVLPTLVMTIAPDPIADKIRKRRSSRAAGLVTSSRDSGPMTLWFRTDENTREGYSLHDWARCIQATIQPNMPDRTPMTPMSPASPGFNNPFAPRSFREASDSYQPRPPSAPKTVLQHKSSTTTGSSRERPVTFSDTPSLRSRRSDGSSLTGYNAPPIATQGYAPVFPSDLPSPATTAGDYCGPFIEGWTSAHGRSSALSSPVRNVRDSMGSMPPFSPPPTMESGSPPLPRETILDRAFQLRYIPGSDQQVPGEEKLSSLARFEALMQHADEQRKLREHRDTMKPPLSPPDSSQHPELKTAWDLDQDSDEVDSDIGSDGTEGDSGYGRGQDGEDDRESMRTGSRTLDYIRGQQTPQSRTQSPRSNLGPGSPISRNEASTTFNSGFNLGRSPIQVRPGFAQKTYSQPSIAGRSSSTNLQLPPDASPGKSSIASGKTSIHEESMVGGLNPAATLYRTSTIGEGRQRTSAGNGGKRISISEFTRRLSSTSSLLLLQTNTSHHDEEDDAQPPTRSSMQPREPPSLFSSPMIERERRIDRETRDQHCSSWRNSVGVFGGEGDFL